MNLARHDDLVREALAFLLDMRAQKPETPLARLLDEAGMRYNLSPLDAERLSRIARREPDSVRPGETDQGGPKA